MGIAIEQTILGVDVCNKEDEESREWFPLETLVTGEANADATLNLTDRFCFVR